MRKISKLLPLRNTPQTRQVGRDIWKELEGFSHSFLFQGGRGLGQILLPIEERHGYEPGRLWFSSQGPLTDADPRRCFQILCEKKNKDNVYVSARMPVVLSQVRKYFILELRSTCLGTSACVLNVTLQWLLDDSRRSLFLVIILILTLGKTKSWQS